MARKWPSGIPELFGSAANLAIAALSTALEDLQRQRGHRAPIRARHQRPTALHQSNDRRLCAKSLSELGFDARLIEVRSLGHSRLDLLTLSSSRFDPKPKLASKRGKNNLHSRWPP
jgi:hypothetical protein